MNSIFTILKVVSLIVLLTGMTLAFIFFRVWQKNERPVILENQWQTAEATLGGSATLEVTLRVPWHREINSANPISFPESLLPVRQKTAFKKGALDLSGHREWLITVPMVATSQKIDDGQTISLPLARTKRISPTSVNVPVPPLTVISPIDLPRDPNNPNKFLVPEPPAPDPEFILPEIPAHYYWITGAVIILGLIGLGTLLYFLLRKAGIIATTPPWEKAMGRLDALDTTQNQVVVLAKLTDILKSYTAERFQIAASAKTSTEFLSSIKKIESIPADQLKDLPWLARVADAAKFAGKEPPADSSTRAMGVVRTFVEKTTPQENTDA